MVTKDQKKFICLIYMNVLPLHPKKMPAKHANGGQSLVRIEFISFTSLNV